MEPLEDISGPNGTSWTSPHPSERGGRTKRRRGPSESPKPHQELGLMREKNQNGPARFLGSSSGIHFVRSVFQRFAEHSLEDSDVRDPSENLIPGEDDQLHGESGTQNDDDTLWRPDEVVNRSSQDTSSTAYPRFEELIGWTRNYFSHWHPAFPMLHAPTILKTFERIQEDGLQNVDPAEVLILRSIVSISLMDSRQSARAAPPVDSDYVFKSITDVFVQAHIALVQPSSFLIVQGTLCVQLLLISLLRFNSASRLGGLIIRMSSQLGLHRCPARYAFSPLECEMRKRVFWTIYYLERLLCSSLGTPLDIQDSDVDTCYPDQELHPRGDGDSTEAPVYGKDNLKLLSYLARHARIRGLIVELRNKSVPHRRDTMPRASLVQGELAKWINEIYDCTLGGDDEPGSMVPEEGHRFLPIHRLLLSILQQETIISLNRPLTVSNVLLPIYLNVVLILANAIFRMMSSPDNPGHLTAVHNCINAARSTISTLHNFQRQHSSTDTNSHHLSVPLVWPTLTWAAWMSCFILAFSAWEGHLQPSSASRCFRDTSAVLQHLALRGSPWPAFCAKAIRGPLASTMASTGFSGPKVRDHPVPQWWPTQKVHRPIFTRRPTNDESSELMEGLNYGSNLRDKSQRLPLHTPPYGAAGPFATTWYNEASAAQRNSHSVVSDRGSMHGQSPSSNPQIRQSHGQAYSSPASSVQMAPGGTFLPLTEQTLPTPTANGEQTMFPQDLFPPDPLGVMELPNLAVGQTELGLDGSTASWQWHFN